MSRRPLFCVAAVFVLGEVSGQLNENMAIIICAALLPFLFLLLFWRRRRSGSCRYRRWLLLLPFFLLLGSHQMQKTQIMIQESRAIASEGSPVKLLGSVVDLGTTKKGKQVVLEDIICLYPASRKEEAGGEWAASGQQGEESQVRHRRLKGRCLIYLDAIPDMKLGQRLLVEGEFGQWEQAFNPGQFDQGNYQEAKGIYYLIYGRKGQIADEKYSYYREGLRQLRNRFVEIYDQLLNEKEAGVIQAMVLGEKSGLDVDIKKLYQQNGIAHILAISGLHISLIGRSTYQWLRKRGLCYGAAGCLASGILIGYGILTGMSSSTLRAVLMLLTAIAADWIGRSYDLLTAMAMAGLGMLFVQPMQLFDAGFLLSYGAILALGTVLPALNQRRILKQRFMSGIISSISIQLVTNPVVLCFYYSLPVYSVLLNLIVIPLMSILVPFAVAGGVMGCLSLFWGRILVVPVRLILLIYEWLCRWSEQMPFSQWYAGAPSTDQLIAYYLVLLAVVCLIYYQKWRIAGVLTLALTASFCFGGEDKLQIVCADVGQGDGIFMKTPSGTTYLIDGGSSDVSGVGTYRLLPLLRYYGTGKLDYALVSHADTDHISGLLELLDAMPIGCMILPDLPNREKEFAELIQAANRRQVPIRYWKQGDQLKDQEVTMTCLHPGPMASSEDSNSNSVVFSLTYRQFTSLFTGDVEGEGEQQLLGRLPDCTLLKTAHHGSKNSTCEAFLNEVRPEYALLSCGRQNRYGHPHQELLGRLESAHCQSKRTDQEGAILIETDGCKMQGYGYLTRKTMGEWLVKLTDSGYPNSNNRGESNENN